MTTDDIAAKNMNASDAVPLLEVPAPTRILVFGASGTTGTLLVGQALEEGKHVTAFVRTPSRFDLEHANLSVVQGGVHDIADVQSAVAGHDAIYCVLGGGLMSKGVRESATRNILAAMESQGVRRLVSLSSYGASETRKSLPFFTRFFIVPFMLRRVFDDHAVQERLLEASDVDWTAICPPWLTDGERTREYAHGLPIGTIDKFKISRADVSDFMLRVGDEGLYIQQKPGVTC